MREVFKRPDKAAFYLSFEYLYLNNISNIVSNVVI